MDTNPHSYTQCRCIDTDGAQNIDGYPLHGSLKVLFWNFEAELNQQGGERDGTVTGLSIIQLHTAVGGIHTANVAGSDS